MYSVCVFVGTPDTDIDLTNKERFQYYFSFRKDNKHTIKHILLNIILVCVCVCACVIPTAELTYNIETYTGEN